MHSLILPLHTHARVLLSKLATITCLTSLSLSMHTHAHKFGYKSCLIVIYIDLILVWCRLGCRFSMGPRYWWLRWCSLLFQGACEQYRKLECCFGDLRMWFKSEDTSINLNSEKIRKSFPAPYKEIVQAHSYWFFVFCFFAPFFGS